MRLSSRQVAIAALIYMSICILIYNQLLSPRVYRIPSRAFKQFRAARPLLITSWNDPYYAAKDNTWFARPPPRCVANNRTYRCSYASRKQQLYNASDAIIISGHTMNLSDLPDLARRPAGQLWIFFNRESPENTRPEALRWSSTLFNVTSTYSLDSDVPTPYVTQCRVRTNPTAGSPADNQHLMDIIRNKTRPVAWFVSNCRAPSLRAEYVEELRRYIEVDVFGHCGQKKCPGNKPADCDSMLNNDYKFYLSFENSLCGDYITEKFSRTLNMDVVSVVLGSGNYTRIAPEDTYIDARSFSSPRHLAEYLKRLYSDHRAYAEFIRRKRNLHCRKGYVDFFCRLCVHLHELKQSGRSQVRDIERFWSRENKCQKPAVYYKNMGLKVRS